MANKEATTIRLDPENKKWVGKQKNQTDFINYLVREHRMQNGGTETTEDERQLTRLTARRDALALQREELKDDVEWHNAKIAMLQERIEGEKTRRILLAKPEKKAEAREVVTNANG